MVIVLCDIKYYNNGHEEEISFVKWKIIVMKLRTELLYWFNVIPQQDFRIYDY